jgi:succinyl-CoA synthetase beta subunit
MPFPDAVIRGITPQNHNDGTVPMNIHEYQAKALLRQYGIPVSDGRVVLKAEEAKTAAGELDGPLWVVKAQIHAGGRGKGHFKEPEAGEKGGVRLARSVEEANQFARQMLGRTLVTIQTGPAGKQVNRIYIEDGSDIARELYLALLIDRQTSRISIVCSTEGGMSIEDVAHDTPEKILSFQVDPAAGFSEYHGRRVAFALGLEGAQVKQCVGIVKNLYRLFVDKDMDMLEINPFVVLTDGTLKLLDAKMSFDGNATEAFKIITSDPNVKGILVNIFGGIMRCDIIAEGVIAAVKEVGLKVPLVVRLEGTNVELGKDIIRNSGLNVIAADNLSDAAQKIVKAVKG